MSKKTTIILAVVVASAIILGLAGYFLLNNLVHSSTINISGRTILYTTTRPYDGGPCAYISFTENGKHTEACIDDTSAKKATEELQNNSPSENISSLRTLMKIDAEVHTVTESRSPSTPTPQPQDASVIVIDNIYSVSKTSLSDSY